MKIRLFKKKFKIRSFDFELYYTAKICKGKLKVYDLSGRQAYLFTKESIFNVANSDKIKCKINITSLGVILKDIEFPVTIIKYGKHIGCCFIPTEQLQEIREEFNYKSIF